jgi:hypothetical protein
MADDQLDMGLLFANLEAFFEDRAHLLFQALRAMSTNNSEPILPTAAAENPLEPVIVKGFNKKKDPSLSSMSPAQTEDNNDAEDTAPYHPSMSDASSSMQESKYGAPASTTSYSKVPSTSEFPNGDVEYCVEFSNDEQINHSQACSVGWAMNVYGRTQVLLKSVTGNLVLVSTCVQLQTVNTGSVQESQELIRAKMHYLGQQKQAVLLIINP